MHQEDASRQVRTVMPSAQFRFLPGPRRTLAEFFAQASREWPAQNVSTNRQAPFAMHSHRAALQRVIVVCGDLLVDVDDVVVGGEKLSGSVFYVCPSSLPQAVITLHFTPVPLRKHVSRASALRRLTYHARPTISNTLSVLRHARNWV